MLVSRQAAFVALACGLAALATLATALPLQTTSYYQRPWFCHNLDCPKYKVVHSTDTYEVREYQAGVWVSTDVEGYAHALAVNTGFKRLYGYIDGQNAQAMKIPMTAPVKSRIGTAAGPFCKNNFTISFFVPFALQDDVPKPNNPDVYVEHQPAFTAYVAQKGGFVLDDYSISKFAGGLIKDLDEAGVDYESDYFILAGYDPPFRLTGRHTEVWVIAKDTAAHEEQ